MGRCPAIGSLRSSPGGLDGLGPLDRCAWRGHGHGSPKGPAWSPAQEAPFQCRPSSGRQRRGEMPALTGSWGMHTDIRV